jgi:N-acetylmuramoyl-L-alanine amidase
VKHPALIPLLAVLAVLAVLAAAGVGTTRGADGPLAGKVIALDAGHGGSELGATYPANAGANGLIYEKDVNLAVVYKLKALLEEAGAMVALTREGDETITSRRDRVGIAIEKCKQLAGRKCDALLSVHHNGSTDPAYDGLLVIYNEQQDLPLATAVHDALAAGLPHPPDSASYRWVDSGLLNGGYGITVYGKLVSVLSEAYYVTNDWEAQQLLSGSGGRIADEAAALFTGLAAYFASQGSDGGCSPGQQKQGKC